MAAKRCAAVRPWRDRAVDAALDLVDELRLAKRPVRTSSG